MAFFEKAKLEVDIKNRPQKRGDVLQALIRVSPDDKPVTVNYVRVSFEYEGTWTIPNADGGYIQIEGKARMWAGDLEQSKNVTLQPGQGAMMLPFEWRVPTDSPLSSQGVKYKLWIRADIPGAKDPEFSTSFDILG
ncbi:MAG TPA: sporulation protein [Kofleriaceae bacterium]|jgi:hypothetical protein|nr:sporulation protein [Kofleriaceae bacterium]